MAEIDDLRAENERLRRLLDHYGIDPEPPGPPEPEEFGPPTLLMHLTVQRFVKAAAHELAKTSRWLSDKAFAEGTEWPPATHLHIRLPTEFTVK